METITIIECICGDGTTLLPTYIFQSKKPGVRDAWVHNDPLKAHYATSPNGWTDSELDMAGLQANRTLLAAAHNYENGIVSKQTWKGKGRHWVAAAADPLKDLGEEACEAFPSQICMATKGGL